MNEDFKRRLLGSCNTCGFDGMAGEAAYYAHNCRAELTKQILAELRAKPPTAQAADGVRVEWNAPNGKTYTFEELWQSFLEVVADYNRVLDEKRALTTSAAKNEVRDIEGLVEALDDVDCGCSVPERLSGHRTECWMPAFAEVRQKIFDSLSELRPGTDQAKGSLEYDARLNTASGFEAVLLDGLARGENPRVTVPARYIGDLIKKAKEKDGQ